MDANEPCAIVPVPRDAVAAFEPVAGQPGFVRVVRSLLGAVVGERLVVAAAPTWVARVGDRLRSADLGAVAVVAAHEPGSRREVITAGLNHLGVEAYSSTPVLVGDHRYPLSTRAVADRVIAELRGGHDVVVPAMPVTDTVKTVDERGSVLATVDRSALRTVQYPRGFTAAALWTLLSGPAVDDGDEFVAALRAGLAVGTVVGDPNAFQVEMPRDAPLLDAVIVGHPD